MTRLALLPTALLKSLSLAALLATTAQCLAADATVERIIAAEHYAMQRTAETVQAILSARWPEFPDAPATAAVFPFETEIRADFPDTRDRWRYRGWDAWGAGFFAGILWHFAEHSADPQWHQWARVYTDLLAGWQTRANDHDIGFNLLESYGRAWAVTGAAGDAAALVTGAGTFSDNHWMADVGSLWSFNFNNSQRLDPAATERVRGPIRQRQNVIIDTSMNIELLFAGARLTGTREWYDQGLSHLHNVVRDMVRTDGSTAQVVDYWLSDRFDSLTGELLHAKGSLRGTYAWQGFSNASAWSRGQAWAIHGLTTGYRETGDPTLLEAALRAAEFYMREAPADGVPYWDFAAPTIDAPLWLAHFAERGSNVFARDSSAAAIAAAGMLELATLLDSPALRHRYFAYAEGILTHLSTPQHAGGYLSTGTSYESILVDAAYTFPGYGQGLIWGDYYFVQALRRYREQVVPPAKWGVHAVAPMPTRHWVAYPDALWAYRSHAGRAAFGSVHRHAKGAAAQLPYAAALYLIPLHGAFDLSLALAANDNFAINPDADALILFDWENEHNHAGLRLSANPALSGFFRLADGVRVAFQTTDIPAVLTLEWQELRLQRVANTVQAYLNGQPIGTLVTPAAMPAPSLVGLGSTASSVWFADWMVQSDEAAPTFELPMAMPRLGPAPGSASALRFQFRAPHPQLLAQQILFSTNLMDWQESGLMVPHDRFPDANGWFAFSVDLDASFAGFLKIGFSLPD